MKKYTLDNIIRRLIKRNYIQNQTTFELQIGDELVKTTRQKLNCDPRLLAPVVDVFIFTPHNQVRKSLCNVRSTGVEFLVPFYQIERAIKEHYNSPRNIHDKFTVRIVCKQLPNKFLNCFLYLNDWISPDIFLALTRFHNTVLGCDNYSNAISFIIENKKALIKQYKLKSDNVGVDFDLNAHDMLESIISIMCGFKVRIRRENTDNYLPCWIIEDLKNIKK